VGTRKQGRTYLVVATLQNFIHKDLSSLGLSDIAPTNAIVRKTQHQNPEFGPKHDEIRKNLHKSTLAFKRG